MMRRLGLWMAVLGGIAAALGLWHSVTVLQGIDPFAAMRGRESPLGADVAMRLNGVTVRQYEGGKLLAEATVDRVNVRGDRRTFEAFGIREGQVSTAEGNVRFAADVAVWDSDARRLIVRETARVWNKDLDVATPSLTIDRVNGSVHTPDRVTGRFFGGQAEVLGFRYEASTETAEIGPGWWEGKLALQEGPVNRPAQRSWRIESPEPARAKGDTVTFRNATATDGEVILKGQSVEYDRKSEVLTVTGRVEVYAPEANLRADRAVVYRRERRTVLTGSVDMLVKPREQQTAARVEEIPPFRPLVPAEVSAGRPDAPPAEEGNRPEDQVRSTDNLRRFPVAITAQRIEYWYRKGERRALATGSPQARQELPGGLWRHVWSHQAFYDGEKETLRLTSKAANAFDVLVKNSVGDDLRTEWALLSTKEGEDDMEWGRSTAVFTTRDDNDAPPATGGGTGGSGTGGGGTGGGGLSGPIGRPPRS